MSHKHDVWLNEIGITFSDVRTPMGMCSDATHAYKPLWPHPSLISTSLSSTSYFGSVAVLEQIIAYNQHHPLCDTGMTFGTHTVQILKKKTKKNTGHPKIQDGSPTFKKFAKNMFLFLYNLKCIDVKSNKCIKLAYKVRYCEYFGTVYMPISPTVFEIQHRYLHRLLSVINFEHWLVQVVLNVSRWLLYSKGIDGSMKTLISVQNIIKSGWSLLKSMHAELLGEKKTNTSVGRHLGFGSRHLGISQC